MAGTATNPGNTRTNEAAPKEYQWMQASPDSLIRKPLIAGYLIILFFFIGLGTWASTAHIAGAIIARGVISPEGSRKTIQHLEGGIITEILVDEGDEVTAGDPLVILQGTQARASFKELRMKKHLFAAKLARLLAEQAGKDTVEFPDWLLEAEQENSEVREITQAQVDLFVARNAVHSGRQAIGKKRIDETEEEISGLQSLIKSKRQQLASLAEELEAQKKLLERKMVARPAYLQLDRLRAEIEGEMAEAIADVARARQTIGETELQIINEGAIRLDEIVSDLADTRVELGSVGERLNAQLDVLSRTVIKSPVSGTVHNKRFYTTGGVIRPGQSIIDIVPLEVELLIDARINPVDIDVVLVGQETRIHFLSFSARRLPQITGFVRSISPDSLSDEVTGENYFRAFVEVPKPELAKLGEAQSINPGMPVEVLIMTGERTLLEYLVEPLRDSLRRSFREN
jgi:HlyD family secretion protein